MIVRTEDMAATAVILEMQPRHSHQVSDFRKIPRYEDECFWTGRAGNITSFTSAFWKT